MKLIIGNKNYSSWSLRAWLILHAFNINFEEVKLALFSNEFINRLAQYKANGKVPLLIDDDTVVWDSLAIAEYINENYLQGNGWGLHREIARSLACEMHSGFFGIRNEMPMNIRANRSIKPSDDCLHDIARIMYIFNHYRKKFKSEGNYLLGEFSIADAFYAPVVFRLATYARHSHIKIDEESQEYCDSLLSHPSMVQWQQDALNEVSIIEQDEAGTEV